MEGKVLDVLDLWNNSIKKDSRIESILSSSFTTRTERNFDSWGLALLSFASSTFALDFMKEHCKHRILHHNKTKTIFVVEDMKTQMLYVLKEVRTLN